MTAATLIKENTLHGTQDPSAACRAAGLFQSLLPDHQLALSSLPPFPHLEGLAAPSISLAHPANFFSLQIHASLGQRSKLPPTSAFRDRTPSYENLARPLVGPHPSTSPRKDTDNQTSLIYLGSAPE